MDEPTEHDGAPPGTFRMLGLVVLGLIVGVLASDVAVGVLDQKRDLREWGPLIVDTHLGWTNRPYSMRGKSRLDGFGLRNDVIPAQAPPQEIRILGMGASRVFGSGVDWLKDVWNGVLEAECRAGFPENPWRVLNGGVNGYSSVQSARRAIKLMPLVEPDLILLFIGPDSQSLIDATGAQNWVWVGDLLAPSDIVAGVPEVLQPLTVRLHKLLLRSNLYARYRARFGGSDSKRDKALQGFYVSRAARSPVLEYEYRRTLEEMGALADAARERNIELRAVVLPQNLQSPGKWKDFLKWGQRRGAPPIGTPSSEPNTVLREDLEAVGMTVWVFDTPILMIAGNLDRHSTDGYHWSESGHRIIADAVYRRLELQPELRKKLSDHRLASPRN